MKTEYSKLLSRITASLYNDVLKPQSFKKKGNTFNRLTSDGLTQVINFQAGAYEPWKQEDSLHGLFTINLGIYVPEVDEAIFKKKKSFVLEYDCQIRTRIGNISGKNDLWFDLKNFKQADEQNLIQLLQQFGVPFLDNFETREKIIKNVSETKRNTFTGVPRILLGLIYFKQGNTAKASELLKKQYDESSDNLGHQKYVVQLSDDLGIDLFI
ncbi:MAG: DUF4304 domain-containing protein [Candidatus Paceibacterota bacterium]|jgi:hypothetical protein